MANPFPFVASTVLTAAQLNGIGEAWTSYTPTVTQGVGVTSTVSYAKYSRVNKIVTLSVAVTCTSAGTAGSTINVTLPVAPTATAGAFGKTFGAGGFYDSSTTQQYNLTLQQSGINSVAFYGDGTGGSYFGQFPGVTIANGDLLFFHAVYEVA
jgi:hypothetical protein